MSKVNQKRKNNIEENGNEKQVKLTKKAKIYMILIFVLSLVAISILKEIKVFSLNNEKSKQEIITENEYLKKEISKLNSNLNAKTNDYNQLEQELASERIKNEFDDIFKNSFEGNYIINGKEGKMKLKFDDTLYGTLQLTLNYSTTKEVIELINNNEVIITYPNIKFKLNDMDKTNSFLTIKGYEITQPTIMNKNKEILDTKFKMIDNSELRLLNLRIWFVEGNKLVGDLMDENDNIIGTFNMKIKESTNNIVNPK